MNFLHWKLLPKFSGIESQFEWPKRGLGITTLAADTAVKWAPQPQYVATSVATAHLFIAKVYLIHFFIYNLEQYSWALKIDELTSYQNGTRKMGRRALLQYLNFVIILLICALFSPGMANWLSHRANLSILQHLMFAFSIYLNTAIIESEGTPVACKQLI